MSQGHDDAVRLAITMGDPAGVGPELSARALASRSPSSMSLVVFGDWELLHAAAEISGCSFKAHRVSHEDWVACSGAIDSESALQHVVVDLGNVPLEQLERGQVSAQGGRASYEYLVAAIDAALALQVDALVTAPINKAALHAGGFAYPGHTEILSERTQTNDYGMMLTAPEITCSLVTTHVPISEVPRRLSSEAIVRMIRLTDSALKKMKNKSKIRLTVLGLNPHAGEGGLFGDEEARLILPAIEQARQEGYDVRGPLPPDTAFLAGVRSQTDGYICMYHDQGLIPLKTLAFDEAVNVTLGLPIVRTSVDHGTAYDIAWKNKVQFSSMLAAIDLAHRLCGV
jgi:4-hydroxythreonine-4-phosphate dehydrogenase